MLTTIIRCNYNQLKCGKNMLFKCKYCDKMFCTKHLQIEVHSCSKLDFAKNKYKEVLTTKLLNERGSTPKLSII